MSSTPTVKLDHLQGLRGLAILAVVLFHFFPQYFHNGYLGVDVFFILSGYLMTMMLSRHDVLHLSHIFDFWYRRVKRIAPLYYLVIAVILGFLKFAENSLKNINVKSAAEAAMFATNLIRPTDSEGYFEKLGAVDMFTHTWSLAVEMQFYLIVPFIFLAVQLTQKRLSLLSLYAIASISFEFYISSDDFTSFNSMFSRIWQFTTGMLSYFYVNELLPSGSETEKEALLEDTVEKNVTSSIVEEGKVENSSQYCIGALIVLLFFPTEVTAHTARILISLLTMNIFQIGKESSLLKQWLLVFIGEISYSWYLVHWPIAAYIHVFHTSSNLAQLAGISASLLLTFILHFGFEQYYVRWEKPATVTIIVVLVIAVGGQLFLLKMDQATNESIIDEKTTGFYKNDKNITLGKDNYMFDYLGNITYGYENKTAEDRIRLNDHYDASDTMTAFCKSFKKIPNFPKDLRCETNEGVNKSSPYKLLVIGNSYASMTMTALSEECRNNFNHIEISFTAACETLVRTDNGRFNCTYDDFFLNAVKEVKPDVLFLMEKHMQMMDIKHGTTPFDDEHFKTASDRLAEIQKHVSRRIFILDAFPEVTGENIETMKAHLRSNATIDNGKMAIISQNYITAKARLSRLVQNCPKCQLFDYAPLFFINGQFKTYDPKYFMSFFSTWRHLTPPGVMRVRPLIRHLCNNF